MWKDSMGEEDVVTVERLLIVFSIVDNEGFYWTACGVYASNVDCDRRIVWNAFKVAVDAGTLLLTIGDFHVALNAEDKKGGAEFKGKREEVRELRECLDSC